jgi:hypothetical protein
LKTLFGGKMVRFLYILLGIASLGTLFPVHAGSITINATFDPSLSSADDAAISAAIASIEADITSPNNLTVNLYYNSMTGGLGESSTSIYAPSYYQYYNALKAVSTQPNQLTALASLGTAPTGSGSGNPVNGNTTVDITSAEGRNLGFNTPGTVSVNGGTYDSEVSLNTSLTYPPGTNNGSNYGLEAVANHETDEALGIGGTGSTIGNEDLTGPVGDLDLYRYTCSVAITVTLTCPTGDASRSYSDTQTTEPYSYFSINGGATVLSFFNQIQGDDYGDWLSNPIPTSLGFGPQVQDAFGEPGTDPALGVNELTAFNAIGYQLLTPEPSSLLLAGLGLGLVFIVFRRRRTAA